MDEIGSFIFERQRQSRGSDERLISLPAPLSLYQPTPQHGAETQLPQDTLKYESAERHLVRATRQENRVLSQSNQQGIQFSYADKSDALLEQMAVTAVMENVHAGTVGELARSQVVADRLGFDNAHLQMRIDQQQRQIQQLVDENNKYQDENSQLLGDLEHAQLKVLELTQHAHSLGAQAQQNLDASLRDPVIEQLRKRVEAQDRIILSHNQEKQDMQRRCNERLVEAAKLFDAEKQDLAQMTKHQQCVQCITSNTQLERYEQEIGSLRAQISALEEMLENTRE